MTDSDTTVVFSRERLGCVWCVGRSVLWESSEEMVVVVVTVVVVAVVEYSRSLTVQYRRM